MIDDTEDRATGASVAQEAPDAPPHAHEGRPPLPSDGEDYPAEIPYRSSIPRPTASALWSVAAFILVGAVIAGLVWFFNRPGEADDFVEVDVTAAGREPAVGEAPPDFQVEDLNGGFFQLSDFAGQPVWITFWASWCAACRAETPDIEEMHQKYSDDGLVIIALNLGETDSIAGDYVERTKTTFLVGMDRDESIASAYWIRGLPMHYFIGTDGLLHELRFGSLSAKSMEEAVLEILPEVAESDAS